MAGIDQRPLREKPSINSAFQKLFPFSVLPNFRYYNAVLLKKGKAELLEARVIRLAKRHFAALGYGRVAAAYVQGFGLKVVAAAFTRSLNIPATMPRQGMVVLFRSPYER